MSWNSSSAQLKTGQLEGASKEPPSAFMIFEIKQPNNVRTARDDTMLCAIGAEGSATPSEGWGQTSSDPIKKTLSVGQVRRVPWALLLPYGMRSLMLVN